MSGKATGMVWELDIPHNQQFVLLAMADHADHHGSNIFPSVADIAWKTGYSERQVQRIIKTMRDNNLLRLDKKQMGRYGTNCYTILWENAPKKAPLVRPDKMSPLDQSRDDKMSPVENLRGDILPGGGDTQMSPDPSSDPSEEKDSMETEKSVSGSEDVPKVKRKPNPLYDWVALNIFKVTPESAETDEDTHKWIGANAAKLVNAEKQKLGVPKKKPLTDEQRAALAKQLPGLLKYYNQQSPGLSPPKARGKFGTLVIQWYEAGKPFSAVLQEVKYTPVEHDDYVAPSEVA